MASVQVPQSALEELLRRALDVAGFPIGWISFVDAGVERIRARLGVTFTELSADRSLVLGLPVLSNPLFVDDAALTDWRTHALVASGPRARFIGVVPLIASGGELLGSLTVLDPIPRRLGRSERTALANIATLAVARVEEIGRASCRERV